jgi:hypothetical protein
MENYLMMLNFLVIIIILHLWFSKNDTRKIQDLLKAQNKLLNDINEREIRRGPLGR